MRKSNRLINEKSPYLLQHAYNPVDWYPWGPEAFDNARREDKPIFLSIGYSTCHWCHVMEQESFDDHEVARLMNQVFVSIKVDREERPDLDNIYMLICQIMTNRGGWPLSIVMTPDQKPFFAATYIPKESRFGRMGMLELIPQIGDFWKNRRDELLNSAESITILLKNISKDKGAERIDESLLEVAYKELTHAFDEIHGGFGTAPKFPTAHKLFFLLRYWKKSGDARALEMVERTLQAMRKGGIYDHLGFGFHRYSTDAEWLVPHFEKMLYDQAMLSMAYLEAYQATGNDAYGETAREIFNYVLRDMTSPEGGFYSAEDADSEGEEGKFYFWTEGEIRQALKKEEADLVIKVFNIEKEGNFSEESTGMKRGRNILHLKKSIDQISSEPRYSEGKFRGLLEKSHQKLLGIREERIRPYKDDKILTDWNGIMVAALAKGAQVFDEQEYEKAATGAVDCIIRNMIAADGRLLHRYRDGNAAIQANVDDYAFLIWGLIELYEATFNSDFLKAAFTLNADLIKHFWDDKGGGFYFTPDDAEDLLVRQKEIYDGPTPSGNSVAMLNLLRLGRITMNPDLEKRAEKIRTVFSQQIKQSPAIFTQFMVALEFAIGHSYEVVIAGNSHAEDTKEMVNTVRRIFLPNKILLFRPTEEEDPDITRIARFTKNLKSIDGKATAYVCRDYHCDLPTTDINEMLELSKR